MCMGGSSKTPKIPDPQPPVQPEREPDVPVTRRRQESGPRAPYGTLLTGGSGVPNDTLNTGGTTLLGG